MRLQNRRIALTLLVAAVCMMNGCRQLIGVDPIDYDPGAVDSGKNEPKSEPDDGGATADSAVAGGDDAPDVHVSADSACGADLKTDPHHCGRCGHDCLGGRCLDGMCDARMLAGNLPAPLAIAAFSGWVYWGDAESGMISRVKTDGSRVERLTKAVAPISDIAVDAFGLVFCVRDPPLATPAAVYSLSIDTQADTPFGGGEPRPLATGWNSVVNVVMDDDTVYFLSARAPAELVRVHRDGQERLSSFTVGIARERDHSSG